MDKIEITYEKAKERYPDKVQELIDKVQSGRSKLKDTDPSTWEWVIAWGQAVAERIPNLGEHLSDIASKTKEDYEREWREERGRSYEQRLEERLDGVRAHLRLGGKYSYQSVSFDGVIPEEIKKKYAKGLEEEIEEDKRILSLTPEELESEGKAIVEELLNLR